MQNTLSLYLTYTHTRAHTHTQTECTPVSYYRVKSQRPRSKVLPDDTERAKLKKCEKSEVKNTTKTNFTNMLISIVCGSIGSIAKPEGLLALFQNVDVAVQWTSDLISLWSL